MTVLSTKHSSQLIAVGGGKGGVGKSVIATNMAVAMALTGQKVVLVDGDFGASNLHALVGISNPKFGFRDFFVHEGIEDDPSDLLHDTGLANLKFLSASGSLPGSADINQKQQNRVMNILRNLKADVVFIDLGPGTGFHTVDFLNLAERQVVVSTPEMTSITNSFNYVKSALFRRISQVFKANSDLQHILDFSKNPEMSEDCYEIDQLRSKIQEADAESLNAVNDIIRTFQPGLVLNRVRGKRDILMGDTLLKLIKKYLDVDAQYLGYIVDSDEVRDSIDDMVPFLIKDPSSKPSDNVRQILSQLTNTDLHMVKKNGSMFVSLEIKLKSGWEQ
ncbi:MinD/ParA family ATP-binding protein [Nitrospina watsonii]|uniref:MinD/ParA family ATP-binding protein n=1 Tax=Nitrospina watsonii TaxID=1323948 RepID=UPI00249367BD|nr:P-loop NTPase [Nitrospina watsonii]